MWGLEDVDFAGRDAATVDADIVAAYESAAGRTLARADPVRLFLQTVAAVIAQQRALIDRAAKMNLLAYADGDYLDQIGALMGVARAGAEAATTTLRFSLAAARASATSIPSGTRVKNEGGVVFAVDAYAEIPIGDVCADVTASAAEGGDAGNGIAAGEIDRFVDLVPYLVSVINITPSAGGADEEEDEHLRDRIHRAPESFSVAGSRGSYEYWAKTAGADIIDVAVHSPEPGVVCLYPLMEGGKFPEREVLDRVADICSAETVRPLTDTVEARSPVAVSYSLSATYWIDRSRATAAASIRKAVEAAAEEWILWQKSALGRDLNPSELVHRMVAAGAKRVDVASPVFRSSAFPEVPAAAASELIYGGLEDG
jgi:phage-related baseplate assembly protein